MRQRLIKKRHPWDYPARRRMDVLANVEVKLQTHEQDLY